MQVKILFDSVALNDRFLTGWGVSYLIDGKVLFDAGGKTYSLFRNITEMDVNIDSINTVVISHNHWDHVGGLPTILKRKKGVDVYACPNFNLKFKDKVKNLHGTIIETDKITEIEKNIFVTGEIFGVYNGECMSEQALIIKTENGISIMTGCAHPGILGILEKVKEGFPQEKLYFVFGGFHLKDSSRREIKGIVERFRNMGVEKVGPSHCSGKEATEVFRKRYGKDLIPIMVGQTLKI